MLLILTNCQLYVSLWCGIIKFMISKYNGMNVSSEEINIKSSYEKTHYNLKCIQFQLQIGYISK